MTKKIIFFVIIPILVVAVLGISFTLKTVSGRALALIRIEGEIKESKWIIKNLKKAGDNPLIKGVVIYLNTPGGIIVSCQEIVDEIDKLKEGGKVVVASLGPIAASGGYHIASASDIIVSNPGTITGSISAIMSFPYIEQLAKKIGVEIEVIKSGRYKDIASPFRKMKKDEKELLQEVVDDVYHQFVDEVVERRGIVKDSIMKIADGRIFSGKKAKELGLVDTLGTLQDAILIAGELAGIEGKPKVIEMEKRKIPIIVRLFSLFERRNKIKLEYIYFP